MIFDNPIKVNQIFVEGGKFYFSLGFDIGEYDDGLWWLQIYDNYRKMIYDKPFEESLSNQYKNNIRTDIRKIIKYQILYPKGFIP